MGIDVHALNFLCYAKQKRNFGDTITIGRQGVHVIEPVLKEILRTKPGYKNSEYCEDLLLGYFGASRVDSVDANAYENATHIHDMNQPLTQDLMKRFDTVFDGGCLEHVFNVPQALKNCSHFLRPGGQIIHVLPANNFCGHGFWQFSPELFFSLYSEENGYDQTEVFLADLTNTKIWCRVKRPRNGERVNVSSSNMVHVLVRTKLRDDNFSHSYVQQSDYLHMWDEKNAIDDKSLSFKKKIKEKLINTPWLYKSLHSAYYLYLRAKSDSGLNGKNPGLSVVKVVDLVNP